MDIKDLKWYDGPPTKTIDFQLEFSQINGEKEVALWVIQDNKKMFPSDVLSGGMLAILSKTLQSFRELIKERR